MRFYRPTIAVLTLIFVCVGTATLYETFSSREPLPMGNTLIGAVFCSLGFVLIFFLIQPFEK